MTNEQSLFGYNGRILHINLSEGRWEIEQPDSVWYRTYVGGSSMAGYYLLKNIKPGIDPLGEENVLVFASSVIMGAPMAGFNRFTVAAKSPLTGGFGECEAGGFWGPELKFAGFDAIVIKGKAPKPVYIWINNGEVEIRDADGIWGQDNWKTQEKIREELKDKKVRVASIGPAGENRVLFANVQHELTHFNGRTGMGAVMGSKNLKAIAVRGKQKVKTADPEKLKEVSKWQNQRIKEHPPVVNLSKYGTSFIVPILNHTGILPTRNFKEGTFDGAEGVSAETMHETIFHSKGSCYACSVKCKREVASEDAKYPLNENYGGPEYETVGVLGPLLEVDNIAAVARGGQICNLLGMDTIAAGNTVAFAMECFEEGVISESDTGGQAIKFGDPDIMISLLQDIATRTGFGNILADGVKRAAETIGKGAEKYAFHIKGSELPVHDGRGKTGMAMGYALSATGADHVECPHDTGFAQSVEVLATLGITEPLDPLKLDAQKAKFFMMGQRAFGVNNCFGICNFCSIPVHALSFNKLVEAINAVTGWDTTLFELMRISERSNVMARVFNNREGFTAADDRVISRWHEKMSKGPMKDQSIDKQNLRDAIDTYYEMSGWDKEGRPTRGKLIELNLEWLVD
jgi:aldehyde:ferredoxin oxidoreductase